MRPMKSLRKTALLIFAAAVTLAITSPARLYAQDNKPDTPAPQSQAPPQPAPKDNPPPAPAQQPAPPPSQGRIFINSTQVVVPVTVKDGSRLVADLNKEDFRIFEDDREQRISFFSNEAFPLSVVILIDNDLKRKDGEEVAASLRSIVAGLSAADEADICRFDQFFHPGKGFTKNQDVLLTQIKRTELDVKPDVAPPSPSLGNPEPTINNHAANSAAPNTQSGVNFVKGQVTKTLDDAVYESAQLLADRGRERRKIIFLISDGQNGTRTNTHSYKDAKKELLKYGVSVYSVAVSSSYFERRFNRLVDYAHDTGGDVYFAAKRAAMEELYSKVTEQARNQYTLAYSPEGTDRAADYHKIEVRVKREGLTIDTREGYYSGAAPR